MKSVPQDLSQILIWLTLVWTHPLSQIGNTWMLLQHFPPIMVIRWLSSLIMVSMVLLCSKVFPTQNQHFGWFSQTFYDSQCSLTTTCFPLKFIILGNSLYFLWFPVLFGSKVLSAQNLHF